MTFVNRPDKERAFLTRSRVLIWASLGLLAPTSIACGVSQPSVVAGHRNVAQAKHPSNPSPAFHPAVDVS